MERIGRNTISEGNREGTLLASNRVNKIAGPPGTGKTTALLGIVDHLLSRGLPPEEIIYTTFTRAGAYEAKDRAIAKFGFDEEQFPYFRTLHSLCYRCMGGGNVMQAQDWYALASQLGVPFSFSSFNEPENATATKGDHMLTMWSLSRAKLIPLRDAYSEYPTNHVCLLPELEHFIETIQDYKERYDKMDYTDILERFVEDQYSMTDATCLIVDEAQDLSNLQIKVIEHLWSFTYNGVWVAGDDDQCVHEWNGANANWFISLDCDNLEILDQSYRIPKTVHDVATKISHRITNRLDKPYKAKEEEGEVIQCNYDQLPLDEGKWLILCRNRVFFDIFVGLCEDNGWAYTGINSTNDDEFIEAARTYQKLADGQIITLKEAQQFYDFISRSHIKYGGKKALQEASPNTNLNLKTLVLKYGLKDFLPITEMLDRATVRQKLFIQSVIENKETLEKPRIEISTIHNAKGRECDNVALFPDMTHKSYQSLQENPDSEHRVFYVGVTRAKKRLFLINPTKEKYYEI